ncbi:MAG: hypothetical protein WBA76_20870 [Phormidesmis sp.]
MAQPLTTKIVSSLPASEPSPQADATTISNNAPKPTASLDGQVQALLQAAQIANSQGDSAAALAQLEQAIALTKPLPEGEARDRLLDLIGSRLIEVKAFDRVGAIAQAMTYSTFGNTGILRTQLEMALIKAYIQNRQTPQAEQFIQSLSVDGRDFYWMVAVEALANQGDVEAAANLFENVKDKDNLLFTDVDGNAIARAYIGQGQFAAAQSFLAQHPVLDSYSSQSYRVAELALWAGRANQMEEAEAIARQLPASERTDTLLQLAKLYQARNQSEGAAKLIDEAAALPRLEKQSDDGEPDAWQTNFTNLSNIALAYAELGKSDTARQVLEAARQRDPAPAEGSSAAAWVDIYARIGDFDQAFELLKGLTDYEWSDGQLRLATAYANQNQYESALMLLGRIPDGILAIPGYSDPKLDLLNQIVKDATEQNQFEVAQRAVLIMPDPADRVLAWVAIASAYQSQQRPQEAVNALDQALAIANTIKQYELTITRNDYYQLSNAGLLTPIAEGYWAAGQQDKAIATAQSAVQSVQAFKSDPQSLGFNLDSLKKIAQLGQDWQQPNLRRAAMLVEVKQLTEAIEEDAQTTWFGLLASQTSRLIGLAQAPDTEPNTVPAEVITDSLSRLETLREQETDFDQQLTILNRLISLYGQNNQPDLMRSRFEQALALIAPLNKTLRDDKYADLALTVVSNSELVSQVLPLISTQKQVYVLLGITQQLAANGQSTQALERFDQAISLADASLSLSDRDAAIGYFAAGLNADGYSKTQQTPIDLLLISRLPQQLNDPFLRALWLTRLVSNLPPSEAQTAYAALPSALAEIPNAYTRRNLLWQAIDQNLSFQQFDRAAQLADALDGEYRQSALSQIELARQFTTPEGN